MCDTHLPKNSLILKTYTWVVDKSLSSSPSSALVGKVRPRRDRPRSRDGAGKALLQRAAPVSRFTRSKRPTGARQSGLHLPTQSSSPHTSNQVANVYNRRPCSEKISAPGTWTVPVIKWGGILVFCLRGILLFSASSDDLICFT